MRRKLLLIFSLTVISLLAAQHAAKSQEQKPPLIYVKHLEPPLKYPPLARQLHLQGTVVVKLTIAAEGTVLAAKSSPETAETYIHPLLMGEAKELVKKWTFGCADCTPGVSYEKTIRFVYQIEGDVTTYDDTRVVMDLPDRVTITDTPPQCDHCPPKKVIPVRPS